ncbi:DUF1003 domain-containing protein [Taibaiella soli]|uniref:DUF1003 domain-containing protein n=1 Tax=Taibaiella soli TaxID=1649169 RepID=A0A2W2AYU4_9BACT|nr:DUF1003 domain-containing protein [Taibaiella soli]PZF72828.1 hypothetical protein DN068_10455 [Taibaiella soli]
MQRKCSINGQMYPDTEGVMWNSLRPSLQRFLKKMEVDWNEDSFISYQAFNDVMKKYIASVAAEELKEHKHLEEKVKKQMKTDETLKPLHVVNPDHRRTLGEQLADAIAAFGGSWPFISMFLIFLVIWMFFNSFILKKAAFDPYPYILLNLILSCLAAIQAPIIMMSQNRQEDKDREHAEYDFKVNMKAETEIRLLHDKLDHILSHQHQHMMEMMMIQIDFIEQIQKKANGSNGNGVKG